MRCRSYRSALAPIEQSCFVGQATAFGAFERARGAGNVVHAKLFAVAVAEIEFVQIAMQVGFADVLINAINAAFEDREEAFNAVGGDDASRLPAARIRLCCE